MKAGNYSNPRWLEWGPTYSPVGGRFGQRRVRGPRRDDGRGPGPDRRGRRSRRARRGGVDPPQERSLGRGRAEETDARTEAMTDGSLSGDRGGLRLMRTRVARTGPIGYGPGPSADGGPGGGRAARHGARRRRMKRPGKKAFGPDRGAGGRPAGDLGADRGPPADDLGPRRDRRARCAARPGRTSGSRRCASASWAGSPHRAGDPAPRYAKEPLVPRRGDRAGCLPGRRPGGPDAPSACRMRRWTVRVHRDASGRLEFEDALSAFGQGPSPDHRLGRRARAEPRDGLLARPRHGLDPRRRHRDDPGFHRGRRPGGRATAWSPAWPN